MLTELELLGVGRLGCTDLLHGSGGVLRGSGRLLCSSSRLLCGSRGVL